MSQRRPSSTAVLVCQGRATADGRYAVGSFSDPIARELLDPAERDVVDRVRAGRVPTEAGDRMTYELVRRTGLTMVPRTISIDDVIRQQKAPQLVLLGAGLDGRAWRMPELGHVVVFELDHPASQHDKLRRLGGRAPTARRVVPVPIDMASEPLGPALEAAGFDAGSGATWVWEGVVPYLTAGEVRSTVAQVAELSAAGTRLVVNYQSRSLPTAVMRRAMRLALRLSQQPDPLAQEPWRSSWRPDQMRRLLGEMCFEVSWDRDLLTLAEGLALPGDNDRSLRNGRMAVAVRR